MKTFLFSILALVFLASPGVASAAAGVYGGYGAPCQPVYGGGEVCVSKGNILINKAVQNPQSGAFVDNLSRTNDPRFSPGQDVIFQLAIFNTGSENFSEVTVTDTFPGFLNFVSGPGSFNEPARTLTFKIQDLKAGESETFNIVARVVDNSLLPQNEAVSCDINHVRAVSGENESTDLSQVCAEKVITTTKGGLPVMPAPTLKETPPTGPGTLALLSLIPAGLGGIFLRRKTSL